MFDTPQNSGTPSGTSVPVTTPTPTVPIQDIFADTDASKSVALTGKNVFSEVEANSATHAPSNVSRSHLPWIVLVVVVFAVLVGGGLWLALAGKKNAPVVVETPTVVPETPAAPAAPAAPTAPVAPVFADADRDGMLDADEAAYGTNPQNPDSDSDGLTDREEILIYKTNPLVNDTDRDSYPDGEEVRNGYDPNGSGKLQDVNRARGQ